MTVIVWNVRKLNPFKQRSMVDRIRKLKVKLVCLLKTRVKENNCQSIINKHFKGWSWLHNYSSAYNGRIWVIWSDHMKVDLVDSTAQCITCKVLIDAKQFYLSVVYGFNEGVERRALWNHLYFLNGALSQCPWMIAGDFNIIAHPSKSSKYNGFQGISNDIKEFQEIVQKLAVVDHCFSGPMFTWSNNQEEGFLARKLDRVLINDIWLHSFAHSTVEFIPPGDSDHCAALAQLDQEVFSPPKPFKLFNFWTKHPEFLDIVVKSWEVPVRGSPMMILQ